MTFCRIKNFTNLSANNKNLLTNSFGALVLRGGGMVLGIATLPLYLKYFNDNMILGTWYTILTVLSWILNFDLGVGNGLRNHLAIAISENNIFQAKKIISSSYIILGCLTLFLIILLCIFSYFINWNDFFNVSNILIDEKCLRASVMISLIGVLCSFFFKLINSIFYALQKSAMNNLLGFITNILIVLYLTLVSASDDVEENFLNLAIYNSFAVNIPLILATFYVFKKTLLCKAIPSIHCYDMRCAKSILGLGMTFLVLQLLYMLITVTNEWFISNYYNPSYCVDYNIYNKIFTTIGGLYMLALTPVWSAITKAYAEKRYTWILKLYKILSISVVLVSLLQILLIPFMQNILDIWLGNNSIQTSVKTICIFVLYSVIFNWIAVQSTMVAGIGKLKVQLYCYLFAAIFKVLGIIILSHFVDNWDIVILVTCCSLLPYCIIQPFFLKKELKKIDSRISI